MASKAAILDRVRRNQPAATELPPLTGDWIDYENVRQQFAEVLEQVGGKCLRAADEQQAREVVEQLEVYQSANTVCSLLEGIGRMDLAEGQLERPHELTNLDLTIAPGRFAVAENGAVWVSGLEVGRAAYFICEHLVLVVPASQVVPNMHEAYLWLEQHEVRFAEPGFGVFISGPSKTADIEQSLVIGAQGPRSLHVVLVENG